MLYGLWTPHDGGRWGVELSRAWWGAIDPCVYDAASPMDGEQREQIENRLCGAGGGLCIVTVFKAMDHSGQMQGRESFFLR